jgi:hypothetical protein
LSAFASAPRPSAHRLALAGVGGDVQRRAAVGVARVPRRFPGQPRDWRRASFMARNSPAYARCSAGDGGTCAAGSSQRQGGEERGDRALMVTGQCYRNAPNDCGSIRLPALTPTSPAAEREAPCPRPWTSPSYSTR